MDRRVTPPRRVTSPTWGPPPPPKQALNFIFVDCLLKVSSIMRCWMVNNILGLYVTFWKLKQGLKHLEVF